MTGIVTRSPTLTDDVPKRDALGNYPRWVASRRPTRWSRRCQSTSTTMQMPALPPTDAACDLSTGHSSRWGSRPTFSPDPGLPGIASADCHGHTSQSDSVGTGETRRFRPGDARPRAMSRASARASRGPWPTTVRATGRLGPQDRPRPVRGRQDRRRADPTSRTNADYVPVGCAGATNGPLAGPSWTSLTRLSTSSRLP